MIHHFVEGWLYALLTCNLSGSRAKAAMRRTLRHRQSENGIVTAMMTYDNIVSRNPQKLFSITAALSATTIQHQRPSMSFHPTQRTNRHRFHPRVLAVASLASAASVAFVAYLLAYFPCVSPASVASKKYGCAKALRCVRCVEWKLGVINVRKNVVLYYVT